MTDRLRELIETAGPVSRETLEALQNFEALFQKWSQRINLAAESTLPYLWKRHILDSAQLQRLAPEAKRWADFGSGGGFPGAVIAVLMREAGGFVDLVESNSKKAAFLQHALIGMPATVHCVRIEDAGGRFETPEIVTARALAPLPRLLEWLSPWLSSGARGLFQKGRDFRREVEESAAGWSFDLVEHRSVTDPDGVILEIRDLRVKSVGMGRQTRSAGKSG